ncbi:MAG TPA: 4-(cytidine 5'-diphospho)-2-C-methyl-D-erythritol kinase [Candidatus Limnocylindria bacterium]|nr:4-(cytidine 5'-diphospho)-2-C-methyl-D-erythritol kinase [Candidatus Limnocylindria bacterium]
MDPLRLEAPAKLNLSLRVIGRRDDGYHELESDLVLLELADRLLALPGCSGLRVEGRDAADLPLDERNLAWRGLVAGLGAPPDLVCLTVEKRIPAAAGLGGGSSDAAAAWRLGRILGGRPERATPDDLRALARIGADVPFFAAAVAAATVAGVGELVREAPALDTGVVLVHPPFRLATADVFGELRPEEWGTLENDLLAPARRLRPALDDLFDAVRRAGGEPRLTGSGPTVFSLDDDPERLRATATRLQAAGLETTLTRSRVTAAPVEPIHEEESE